MRIGITGRTGRLGNTLMNQLPVEPCTLDNAREFDIIIHTAAYTDVDGAETNIRDCLYSNFIFTENLRQDTTAKIIYISTDFIFDGKDGAYTETDEPNPISVYGWSKWLGERCLAETDLVIRTTVLYDSIVPDFVTWVLKELQEVGEVHVSSAMFTSPTNVQHLAEAIWYLVKNPLSLPVINIAGSDVISRYAFANMIAEKFGYDLDMVYHTDRTRFGDAKRPIYAGLCTTLAKNLGVPIYSVDEGLELLIKDNEYVNSLYCR